MSTKMIVDEVENYFPEGQQALVKMALDEDLGERGDITSIAMIDSGKQGEAVLLAKETCVVSGGPLARMVFQMVDARIEVTTLVPDGCEVTAGTNILSVRGPVQSLLTAERTALNFMQRLSGVATMTRTFTCITEPFGTKILDTRKTTPGMRLLEKYAVRCGGGSNHRMGLYDRVLIKDNHRAMWAEQQRGDLGEAVRHARDMFSDVMIEIEVETVDELRQALPMKPEWVLLDNMGPEKLRECVDLCKGICLTEASGGITLANVKDIAASGVDAISLGCLTHSAPSVDLSLEMV